MDKLLVFLYGCFCVVVFFIFATIVIYSPTPGGRVNKHMGSKLLCKIDKVKFMDVALSTSNSHPIKLFSYSHIVYSIFYCKFEVLQRCSQPNTTMIMKTIKVTYTETYIVTEERIVEVSNATFKKLQNEDSEEYERLLEEMNGVTCAIESPTERDQTFMDIELATEKDIEEVTFTLDF